MEKQAIETFSDFGYKAEIFQDEVAEDPRNWDNVSELVFFGRDAASISAKNAINPNLAELVVEIIQRGEFTEDELQEIGFDPREEWIAFELVRLCDFGCSGFKIQYTQGRANGIAYIERRKWESEGIDPVKHPPRSYIEGEIAILNQYFSGDVYGYVITDTSGDKDSCWGFYGIDSAIEEAKSIIEYYKQQVLKERILDKVA